MFKYKFISHKLSILLILLALPFCKSMAEYNGNFIKFQIENSNGDHIKAYVYIASAYFETDSLENTEYLIRKFENADYRDDGILRFYHHLISYQYQPYGSENDTSIIYSMVTPDSIALESIKNVKVLEMISFGYLMGISTSHQIEDTVWMKRKPVQAYNGGGYFCDWQMFIHEMDEQTETIAQEFLNVTITHQKLLEEYRRQQNAGYIDPELQEKVNQREEFIDEEVTEILKRLDSSKAVVITFCSC